MVENAFIPNSADIHPRWPPLPNKRYIAGRAATVDDVDSGDAIFCQQAEGKVPLPLSIAIPQYGMLSTENGDKVPGVVIQAEQHVNNPNGEPIILGMRTLDGTEVVATKGEIELLGVTPPER